MSYLFDSEESFCLFFEGQNCLLLKQKIVLYELVVSLLLYSFMREREAKNKE
jgi:hypothetical protein